MIAAQLHLSPRCGARTRSESPCRSPAMPNGRCRMHAGKSAGAPKGNKNALKHGCYTAEAVLRRRAIASLLRAHESSASRLEVRYDGASPGLAPLNCLCMGLFFLNCLCMGLFSEFPQTLPPDNLTDTMRNDFRATAVEIDAADLRMGGRRHADVAGRAANFSGWKL
jgi:hypothetical protein